MHTDVPSADLQTGKQFAQGIEINCLQSSKKQTYFSFDKELEEFNVPATKKIITNTFRYITFKGWIMDCFKIIFYDVFKNKFKAGNVNICVVTQMFS